MSHSTTLIGTVSQRAVAKHGHVDDYVKAKQIWLDEAKAWRDELQAEGLTKTVEQLNKAIAFFEKE